MRNDVSIPPEDSDALDAPFLVEMPHKEVSARPIPPAPGKLKADVELYDHPNFAPDGAGNFWLLGMIGIGLVGVAIILLWMVGGIMK
jgi:hypothetical protein